MRLTRLLPVLALLFSVGCDGTAPRVTEVSGPADPADPQAPTGGVNRAEHLDAPYVVMVSADGFAARYVGEYEPPNLLRLIERGLWAPEGMIPSYPTKTFPNHYTMATGLYPGRHGIVANTFWDPVRGATYRIGDRQAVEDGTWYGGEPIWVTAERQGMVAASFFWVGSEADVGGVRPSHWRRYDGGIPNEDRVDQVLAWLDYPPERRPHLITLYFSDTDGAGHRYGPGSAELEAAVADVDRMLGRLLDGLEALPHGDEVIVVWVSDHGMDSYTAVSTRYLEDAVSLEGLMVPEAGPNANVWLQAGQRATELRDRINQRLDGVTAFLRSESPARLHYRQDARIGDLVLLTDSSVVVYPTRSRPPTSGFTHGWDPGFVSMRAVFAAAGGGLPEGIRVPPFENVHIYPWIAGLLGLSPASGIDGDPTVLGRWMDGG